MKSGTSEHGKVHRCQIVTEAGFNQFLGLDRTTGTRFCLDHCDLPAFRGQMNRCCQPVVTAPRTTASNSAISFHQCFDFISVCIHFLDNASSLK